VVAADRDVETLMRARQKYTRANLAFVLCDAQALPFRAASFGMAVSFEVIEHIPNVQRYLEEIKRVSVGTGIALVSTPNRVLRLLPFQKPWNRFHLREYDARGFTRVLGAVFPRVELCGLTATPAILEIEKRRVRQNPLVAYPKMLAQILLPQRVYEWLKAQRARNQSRRTKRDGALDVTRFTIDDFRMVEDELKECINWLAICKPD